MTVCQKCNSRLSENSQYCPACGTQVPPAFAPTGLGATEDPARDESRAATPADPGFAMTVEAGGQSPTDGANSPPRSNSSLSGSATLEAGRVINDRYRVVSKLGQGGMGVVFRADDLKLGQPVALKFLPANFASDPRRFELLLNEVRIARQVSHPNVCRVYDVGESEGNHFISMELIEGEDLAVLTRRIGKLPYKKASDVARQICAGLGAAHARGVLHRDLKPANIMIDAEGDARITDFGLASPVAESEVIKQRVGTPQYMAPEQFLEGETSIRSDIFALGLVLYELFSGKRAIEGKTLAELREIHERDTLVTPSLAQYGVDRKLEKTIQRCLEIRPNERPASALEVAASMPGADPLAEALAAGQTPSPKVVAASGEAGVISGRTGLILFAGILLALTAVLFLSKRANLVERVGLNVPPASLEQQSKALLERLGYFDSESPPRDVAFGYDYSSSYLQTIKTSTSDIDNPFGIYFWFRTSRQQLTPTLTRDPFDKRIKNRGIIWPTDPPFTEPGMTYLELDSRGELLKFASIPDAKSEKLKPSGPPDWPAIMESINPDFASRMENAREVETAYNPPFYVDDHRAWIVSRVHDDWPEREVRIEAATLSGKLAYFEAFVHANDVDDRFLGWSEATLTSRHVNWYLYWIVSVILLARNWHTGKIDWQGAAGFGITLYVLNIARYLLQASHRPDLLHEIHLSFSGGIFALSDSLTFFAFYLALEPIVRRYWPQSIVSWMRLLRGRFTDPMIGKHVLIGVLGGVVAAMLLQLQFVLSEMFASPRELDQSLIIDLNGLLGARQAGGAILLGLLVSIYGTISFLLAMLILRQIFRKPWLAIAVLCAMFCIRELTDGTLVEFGVYIFGLLLACVIITSYGAIAASVALAVMGVLILMPITTDLSAWYASSTVFSIVAILAVALLGLYTSLGGVSSLRERQQTAQLTQ